MLLCLKINGIALYMPVLANMSIATSIEVVTEGQVMTGLE